MKKIVFVPGLIYLSPSVCSILLLKVYFDFVFGPVDLKYQVLIISSYSIGASRKPKFVLALEKNLRLKYLLANGK